MMIRNHFSSLLAWATLGLLVRWSEAQSDCGVVGSFNQSITNFYMGNFFYNAASTFALCADVCQNDSNCLSFRYSYYSDANAQYCEFFPQYV